MINCEYLNVFTYLEPKCYVGHSNREVLDLGFEAALLSCTFAKEVLDSEEPDCVVGYTHELEEGQIPKFLPTYIVIIVEVKDG